MTENPFAEPDDNDRTIVQTFPRQQAAPAVGSDSTRTAADAPLGVPPGAVPGGAKQTRAAEATVVETLAKPRRMTPRRRGEPEVAVVASSSPLGAAAAPLLQLLARLRNTLTPPDSGDLRGRAAAALRGFEREAKAAGVPDDLIRPAHYALCASLDDVVLNTPWGSQGDWASHSLISSFHNEVRSGERFFDILAQMRENPARCLPVLEIMYACLSLGFMGRYRLSPRGSAEVDRLREDLYAAIAAVRPVADPELSANWRGVEAPYRPTVRRVPFWVSGSAGLAVLGGVFIWASLGLNTASDAAYEAALRTPPVTMPDITRAGPVQAPTPAASSEPGALDHLRAFLKPEIDAGLVEVLGTDAAPIIRLHGGETFAAGSATPLAKATPVLQRIGAALKAENGSVQVIGYTDNEPIRTVRFPSNFQLSAARAASAGAILAAGTGEPGRIATEGRADADPIAPNTTPQGRAANRRIEIVLHRQG